MAQRTSDAAPATGTISTLIGEPIGSWEQGWGEDETRANVITQDLKTTARKAEEKSLQLNLQVISSLNGMKRENGFGASASVSITNCTGANMKLQRVHNYHGHIGRYPVESIIGPGQIAMFLHTKTKFSCYGSKAILVYRVVTPRKRKKDVLLAFDVSWNPQRRRHVHVEIETIDHYNDVILSQSRHQNQDTLRERIARGEQNIVKAECAGLKVKGHIGQAYNPICRFTIEYSDSTLDGAK